MWIAKPVNLLTPTERASWIAALGDQTADGAPIAQTLDWAHATQSVLGKSFLVFSPEERVGGIVHALEDSPSSGMAFECTNGPLLHWDNPANAPRQIATFAMAVSRLDARFKSLTLRPRWDKTTVAARLKNLPLEPHGVEDASTLLIPLNADPGAQWAALSPRLRRSIRASETEGVTTRWSRVRPVDLPDFVSALGEFARSKNFFVPPLDWFAALTGEREDSTLRFWLCTASCAARAEAQLLIATHQNGAHYLFGFERRTGETRAAVSVSACAQWRALQESAALGARLYDMNGYLPSATPDHPYFGVSRFKEQFRGQAVHYSSVSFVIA